MESDGFRVAGNNVQPSLTTTLDSARLAVIHGFARRWAVGAWIPWKRTCVRGLLGGYPGNATVEAIGEPALFAKHVLMGSKRGSRLVAMAGIEFPAGLSDATFDQNNAATNGYYQNSPGRLPIGWQPSSGTLNGYLSLAYGRKWHRLSYEGILAGKFYSTGDEGTKVGNIFVAAATGTYGMGKNVAASLDITLRNQQDDFYPNAPAPGVYQPPDYGTTTHGTTVFLEPSIRFNVLKMATVGIGVFYPMVKPDNGLVQRSQTIFIVSAAGF